MKPKVLVCFLPSELNPEWLPTDSALVIDLLRASTTICHALAHGARDVIPVESPSKAQELRGSIGRDGVLLCGERHGVIIDGFDLGNSPFEYRAEKVAGKTLLFCSSNGSGALLAAQNAQRLALAALVNAGAAVDWLLQGSGDALLVCSGQLGRFSAEDAACAGFLAARLLEHGYVPGNDAACTALLLSDRANRNWPAFLEGTDHGRYLTGLGFGSDLVSAAALDTLPIVPEWKDSRLTCTREIVRG